MPVFDFSNDTSEIKEEVVKKENGNIIPLVFSQIQINRQLLNLKKKMAQSAQIS